jgi:uncharacterized membrane protein YdbT with pleckstrin-like domain
MSIWEHIEDLVSGLGPPFSWVGHLEDRLLSIEPEEDEERVLLVRRSTVLLVFRLLAESLLFIPILVLSLLYVLSEEQTHLPGFLRSVVVLCALAAVVVQALTVIRWFFRVYVVTTKRAFARQGIVSENRLETRLEKVENVTVTTEGLIRRLLHIGDIRIVTAGLSGDILFAGIANPNQINDQICRLLLEHRESRRRLQQTDLRRILGEHMTTGQPAGEAKLVEADVDEYPQIVWRKHPYVLLLGISFPLLAVLLSLAPVLLVWWAFPDFYNAVGPLPLLAVGVIISGFFTLIHFEGALALSRADDSKQRAVTWRRGLLEPVGPVYRIPIAALCMVCVGVLITLAAAGILTSAQILNLGTPVAVPVVLYELFLALWLIVRVVDWRNDQYILTDNQITDIMRIPIVYSTSTQAPLARIQNVRTSVSFVGRLLDFGDLDIETAGMGRPITFPSISHPIKVRETIFRYMDGLTERQRSQQQTERQIEMIDWLDGYRYLTNPPCDPPVHWPE